MEQLGKSHRILFWSAILLVAALVTMSFFHFFVWRDYIVSAQADCDPATEVCFVHICDSEADGECVGDPEKDTSYYKLIRRNAKNIPMCDPSAEGCDALMCPVGEVDCTVVFCDDSVLKEIKSTDTCNDPAEYVAAHQVTDESGGDGSDGASNSASDSGQAAADSVGSGE